METATKFKKKFLYRDDNQIDDSLALYEEWKAYLENGLKEAQKLFEKPLTVEEKVLVLSLGWPGVEQLLKQKSQFPKADVDTLLKLQGLDGSSAKTALLHVVARFEAVGYSVDSNGVNIKTESYQNLVSQNTYHTRNQHQNDMLDIAEKLSEALGQASDLGLIGKEDKIYLSGAGGLNRFLVTEYNEEGNVALKPNVRHIATLKN